MVGAGNGSDAAHVTAVANQAREVIEARGYTVSAVNVPEAGKHPHTDQMNSLLFMLEAFGVLALILGAILVANVISALLAQQIRQIGSMKTVGARTRQIAALYAGSVLILGFAALAIGLPLGVWAGRFYAGITAAFLNFDVTSNSVPLWVYALMVFVGLAIPLLGALVPVLRGSRITVREALSDYGIDAGQLGISRVDSLLGRLRWLGRPLLLSLRNTFRRRTRLALTVLVMAVGGAIFLSAINVSVSWANTVDVAFASRLYDITTRFTDAYPSDLVEEKVRAVPGVTAVESWGQTKAVRKFADGTDGIIFTLTGVPPATEMIDFPQLEGRWLEEGDANVLVVNHELLDSLQKEGVEVGDTVTLTIRGQNLDWQLVGSILEGGAPRRGQNIAASAYVNIEFLNSLTGMDGLTNRILVQAAQDDDASLRAVIQRMEATYEEAGLKIVAIQPSTERKQELLDHLLVIQFGLAVIAGLIVAVGGLGLASTMSINILERTRELGVMRAIGATSDAVLQVVVLEGVVISLLSWLGAVILARPFSTVIGNFAGQIFIGTGLDFVFPPLAALAWLVGVLLIGLVASGIPAWNAVQMPVREALVYE